jgi:hypothetical protein
MIWMVFAAFAGGFLLGILFLTLLVTAREADACSARQQEMKSSHPEPAAGRGFGA